MIYFDNAATTYPKPISVTNAVARAMKQYGANPGRGGHEMSIRTAEEIFRARKSAADFFHAKGEECVAFTLNCTHATNIVLKGLLKPGDHVVTSCLEHNAIMRPLNDLSQKGITFTAVDVYPGDNDATLDAFRKGINQNTRLIACMHASNVWGIRLPIERIAALAKEYQIPFLVDAAQSAGVLPIDMQDMGIDFLCLAGHKGLYGPMGTGMLITDKGENLRTIIEGGTGTNSLSMEQPDSMPDKFESGTPNVSGIIGLAAGIEYIKKTKIETIAKHEYQLVQRLYDKLSRIKDVELYMKRPDWNYFAPLLSFNLKGKDSETTAGFLSKRGIAVRAGLHCAPSAHRFCGTIDRGAVRVCPSIFSKSSEIDYFVSVVQKIAIKN